MTTLVGDDGRRLASAAPIPPHQSTVSEDRITLALSAWVIGGMFLDGYAHAYVIDTATEDFFTPWHGIFYAGFTVLAAWIGLVGYRRRRPGTSILEWFPPAYRPAVVGLVVFAVGGVGDGIWHTIFGVEVGIDALLSPTHLLLFAGSVLLLWTPVRASAARADRSPWLAVGAATLTIALLVFLTQYLWLVPHPWYARQFFDPNTGAGSDMVQLFLGSAMVSAAVLVGPLRLVARHWALPFGAAAVAWGVAAALEALAFSQEAWVVPVAVVAGLVHDVVLRAVGSSRVGAMAAASSRVGAMAAAFAGPAALFALYLVVARLDGPLGWPPEIWGGLVVMAGGVGLAIVLLEGSAPEPRDAVGQPAGPLSPPG